MGCRMAGGHALGSWLGGREGAQAMPDPDPAGGLVGGITGLALCGRFPPANTPGCGSSKQILGPLGATGVVWGVSLGVGVPP